MKYWEIIADNLGKAGWICSCVSAEVPNGRPFFIAYAHRSNGKRFVVRADEKLSAFLELEAAIALRRMWKRLPGRRQSPGPQKV